MKSTVVDESLSTTTTRVLFQRIYLIYLKRQQNEKFVPNVWEEVLFQVPIEWRVINMNIHGLLMFLVTLHNSLMTMVKHWGLTGCPMEWLWLCIGDGALRCSLSMSPRDLPHSPMYCSGQLMCGHLNLYITPHFWSLLSLSLGAMRRVLMVLVPLKCTWIPKLLHDLLKLFPSPWMYGTTIEMFLLFDPLLLLLGCWIGCLSIVDVVFGDKFVLPSVESPWWEIASL